MNFCLNVHKNANDLRLMSCCYKTVVLPEIQSGSAMNPGKINPVVPEMLVQVVYYMEGNDLTISRSVAGGDMEFNTNMPIIFACLFENLNFIRRAIRTLREKCLEGLQVNGIEDIMSLETGILAMLQPKLGYKTCREIVDYAGKENKTIISVLLEHEYVTKEELEKLYTSLVVNAQSGVDFEWLIMDDGSTDNTLKNVRKYKSDHPEINIRIIHNKINHGLGHAKNVGYANARGDYINQLDSDDFLYTEEYEKAMAQLDGTDMVYISLRINSGAVWQLRKESNYLFGQVLS